MYIHLHFIHVYVKYINPKKTGMKIDSFFVLIYWHEHLTFIHSGIRIHTLTPPYHLLVWQIYYIIDIIINTICTKFDASAAERRYSNSRVYVSINNNAHVKCGFYHCTEKLYWWIANNRHVTALSQYVHFTCSIPFKIQTE